MEGVLAEAGDGRRISHTLVCVRQRAVLMAIPQEAADKGQFGQIGEVIRLLNKT